MYEMTAPQVQSDETRTEVNAIALARRDPAAFKPLYVEYFPRIYRYCLRRLSVPQEAEDVTSQIFTRALTHLASFRGGSFAAWLFRIAHNATINHLRDRRAVLPLDAPHDVLTSRETPKALISPGGKPDPQTSTTQMGGHPVQTIKRGQDCITLTWDVGALNLTLTNPYDPPGHPRYSCDQLRQIVESIR